MFLWVRADHWVVFTASGRPGVDPTATPRPPRHLRDQIDAQGADAGEERHPPKKSKNFENLQKMKFLKSDCMMFLINLGVRTARKRARWAPTTLPGTSMT